MILQHGGAQPSTSALYTKGAERRAMASEAMKSISWIRLGTLNNWVMKWTARNFSAVQFQH
jgi:hypothetical protein